jgi:putative transposase
LLGVPRASYYYKPIPETKYNLLLMSEIDKQYLSTPSYGSRLMTAVLRRKGYQINRKRVSRLMREMGLEAMYPKPKRQAWEQRYGKFPYLLKNIDISYQNHVWGTDITYIPVENGYVYLVAFVDLYSRFVLSWELSNSLESKFCVEAMKNAFKHGKPLIINSDQGVQFTSHEYISILKNEEIAISMSGKGRCWDNIFVERFWRTIKYEEIYLKQYTGMEEAYEGIDKYIKLYNSERPHSSLNNKTPSEVYGRLFSDN